MADTNDIARNLQVPSSVVSKFQEINAKSQTSPSPALVLGAQELNVKKLSPKKIEQYALAHPVIPRGIEIKANRMTGRGYSILPVDDSAEANQARERMEELLRDSGGTLFLNGWIRDAYLFGNGYVTLLPDEDSGEIVYLSREHPMFLRIARAKDERKKKTPYSHLQSATDFPAEYGPMKINPVTKQPTHYTQVVYESPNSDNVVPVGQELTFEQVAHLVFETWGDEADGIALVQYLHLILKYLMNIEEAGAEAIYRSGFTQKKVTTTINNEEDLKKMAKNIQQLNASDAMLLPEGTDVTNLSPGQTEMHGVHDIFLTLLAIRLGVPKPILTLDGTDTNKATMRELMRDLIYDITADELKVKRTIEEQIFKPACKSIFGENFEKVPTFKFHDFEESLEEKATTLDLMSQSIERFGKTYEQLVKSGQPEVAKEVLKYMILNVKKAVAGEEDDSIDELILPIEKRVQESNKPNPNPPQENFKEEDTPEKDENQES